MDVADTRSEVVPAFCLFGGMALYFLAHVAVRLRIRGGLARGRPIASLVLSGCSPIATDVPALTALALAAAVCAALITYEASGTRRRAR